MASRLSKVLGMGTVLFLVMLSGLYMVFLLEEVSRRGTELVVAGLLGLVAVAWLLFRGPVGKAIASMLEGREAEHDPMVGARLAEVEDRLQEISLETQRLMEIEDRLDFTERLLAQHTDPGRLVRGDEEG